MTFLIWNAGIAVVSSIAIPTAELVSSFQFQVSHSTTVERRDLREAAEHEEITVNGTAVSVIQRRPPLRGGIKNGLCTLHLLMPVLGETVATVSLSTVPTSSAVSNYHIPQQCPGRTFRAVM